MGKRPNDHGDRILPLYDVIWNVNQPNHDGDITRKFDLAPTFKGVRRAAVVLASLALARLARFCLISPLQQKIPAHGHYPLNLGSRVKQTP